MYYCGSFLNPTKDGSVEYLSNTLCKVEENGIISMFKTFESKDEMEIEMEGKKFVQTSHHTFFIPGFIDCHTHAPQYRNLGIGLDKPLLEWLDEITFQEEIWYAKVPEESNSQHYKRIMPIFTGMVKNYISSGTTTTCYFGSHDMTVCKILFDVLHLEGQRAFVGHVLMDINCPPEMISSDVNCYKELEEYISGKALLKCIGTPRFALTSSKEQMKAISSLAPLIQSHLSENKEEVLQVKMLYPDEKNYLSVSDSCGLLSPGTIMAHCIYLDDDELSLMFEKGVSVAHCPNSNYSLNSGIMDLWRLEEKGIVVGLGSDVSGGYGLGILDVMRQAIIASKCLMMIDEGGNKSSNERRMLSYEHALYLGTLGGANALGISNIVGSFEVGKRFDALLIGEPENMLNSKEYLLKERVERFSRIGDDRWIKNVWIDGRLLKEI